MGRIHMKETDRSASRPKRPESGTSSIEKSTMTTNSGPPIKPKRKETPLLQITLDESDSVPKVFYKGEEIKLKKEVIFHWETDTDIYGGTTIEIEHFVQGVKVPECNRIVKRFKAHAHERKAVVQSRSHSDK